jgi:hypothetical protein
MKSRKGWSIFSVVAVLGAIAVFSRIEGTRNIDAASPPKPTVGEPHDLSRARGAVDASSTARAQAPSDRQLERAYKSASDYAQFVEDALKRPEEGGYFYATLAATRCVEASALGTRVRGAATPESPAQARAQEIIKMEAAKCAPLEARYGPGQIALQVAKADFKRDPMLSTHKRDVLPVPEHLSMKILSDAVQREDPFDLALAIADATWWIAASEYRHRPGLVAHKTIYAVAGSAACTVSGTCDSTLSVLAPCALFNDCDAQDMRVKLRRDLPHEQQRIYDELFVKVMAYTRR